jgi:hypothetical protein
MRRELCDAFGTPHNCVVSRKFAEKVCMSFTVMPVKTGVQKFLRFLDSGSRHPGL